LKSKKNVSKLHMFGIYICSEVVIGALAGMLLFIITDFLPILENYNTYIIMAILSFLVPIYLFNKYTLKKNDLNGFIAYVVLYNIAYLAISSSALIYLDVFNFANISFDLLLFILRIAFMYWYANKTIE